MMKREGAPKEVIGERKKKKRGKEEKEGNAYRNTSFIISIQSGRYDYYIHLSLHCKVFCYCKSNMKCPQ